MQIILILLIIFFPYIGHCYDPGPLLLSEAPPPGSARSRGFESEHRPQPVRRYRLVASGLSSDLKAFVLHPTGSFSEARVEHGNGGITVSFKTPFGDGPMHGVHNLYVVDRQVIENRLVVRVAKWHTIHHSCGWGHAYKYDRDRVQASTLSTIPLEISCKGLWDKNFHSNVRSGDRLRFDVRNFGVLIAGSEVSLTSGGGWTKQSLTGSDGIAVIQLIRDYYPKRWGEFHSRHRERFIAIAEYEVQQKGFFAGQAYDRIHYISSIPWTYAPSRSDYTSYLAGLSIGCMALFAGVAGVYVHRERRKKPYREIVFSEKG